MTALLLLILLGAEPLRGDAGAAVRSAAEMVQSLQRAFEEADKHCGAQDKAPFPPELERTLGQKRLEQLEQRHGAALAGPVADYVQKVGATLARHAQRKDLAWTFVVLESARPASGFVPGGRVLVTTGLLAALKNEAQLAAVLAHELAHLDTQLLPTLLETRASVCRSHRSMTQALQPGELPEGWTPIDAAMVSAMEEMTYLARLELGPTADQEGEADQAAVALLQKAGYALAQLKAVLQSGRWGGFNESRPLTDAERLHALADAADQKGGRAPAFPKGLAWPGR